MSLCPYCGVSNEENAKFCVACGAQQATAAPETEDVPPADSLPENTQQENVRQEYAQQVILQQEYARQAYEHQMYAQPVITAPPKKSNTKWIILGVVVGLALLVCAAIAMFLQFRNITADPNVGLYTGERADMLGKEVDVSQLFDGGFTVELMPLGICTVTSGQTKGTGKWSLQGDIITIDDGESTITGTLRDGVLVLKNVMDMGVDLYLTRNGAEIPSANPDTTASNTVQADWWNGDWYGWWMMSSCEDDYADMENQWWDCIATITMEENGQGHILLWDEDLPKSNALAEFDFEVKAQNNDEIGTATCNKGYFMDMQLDGGEITLDPAALPYENLICLTGWYEDETGGFFFELYIRPWGQRWDDWVADEDDSILPYFYNDFYIPAIEAGQTPPEDITAAWGSEVAEPQEQ